MSDVNEPSAQDAEAVQATQPVQAVALDLRDHVAFDERAPAVRPIVTGAELRLDLVCLEPRQAGSAGVADHDLLCTVIAGRAWVVVEDTEVTLDPLQAVLVPAGGAYGVRNDSADPLILQVVTSSGAGALAGALPVVAVNVGGPPPPGAAGDVPAAASPREGLLDRMRRTLGSR